MTSFQDLVEPHRRELLVHCYRMLGSLHDAEDALQDTLLAAWQGFAGFEGRSSLRTWLYRIATNRCLNARRSTGRQPSVVDVSWLEPIPSALLDPADTREQHESISLAFVTALQILPPRQVAVLVLREVLGFPATEVAGMLGTTVESVTSALKRARAGVREARPSTAPVPAVVADFVRAYESADVPGLIALLTDDAFIAMPPQGAFYQGRAEIAALLDQIFASGRRTLVATSANHQPALAVYAEQPDGTRRASSLLVLTLDGPHIAAMTRFESRVLPRFGLAAELPPSSPDRHNSRANSPSARF